MNPLLNVENLSVTFSLEGDQHTVVQNVSFDLFPGEALGIVGESGSGKTTTVEALAGLTVGQVTGQATLNGVDLLQPHHLLGTQIGMVFQDPLSSLNPTMPIGKQLTEGMLYHEKATRREAKERALELLSLVGLPDPLFTLTRYPHHLSGGMRQRVLIAIALACRPSLLIADEPTTALDAALQDQILELLQKLQKELKMSILFISHDLNAVGKICDRILVMHQGKIVEQGATAQIFQAPQAPYTKLLLNSALWRTR